MGRFLINRMSKTNKKMLKMSIRQLLPETMTLPQKCALFEELAEEYRKKSREDVYKGSRMPLKGEDYSPILPKTK